MTTTYFMHPKVKEVWKATTKKARTQMEQISEYTSNFGKLYVPIPAAYAKKLIGAGWAYVKVDKL